MDKSDTTDQEQLPADRLDQVSSSLIASLQESKALNSRIQSALQGREHVDVVEPPQPVTGRGAGLFHLLDEILKDVRLP
jgi:hypothetical protein